jgi:glycosyltransferase involved in cell wall biosynthesis
VSARTRLRIAQVAPLYESVPPTLYGGTERVIAYLTDELVRNGHDVTLFASGDSVTSARLVPVCERGLRLDARCVDPLSHHIRLLDRVFSDVDQFDVTHFHVDYLHFPLSRRWPHPHLTTLHGRLDLPDLVPVYREFPDMPVVSISDAQRTPLPWVHWAGTVYHGLPGDLFAFHEHPRDYLAFVGRISPEKAPDRAIELARRTGLPLRIGAKVDRADREYFETTIEPLLSAPGVEWLGEVGGREKEDLLGHARALLCLGDWPEPFGLVMIEALACGTPVIAWRAGSIPEVVDDGIDGFVVSSMDEAVEAVGRLDAIDRGLCRATFEARFLVERMAADYVRLYERQLGLQGRGDAAGMPARRPSSWTS